MQTSEARGSHDPSWICRTAALLGGGLLRKDRGLLKRSAARPEGSETVQDFLQIGEPVLRLGKITLQLAQRRGKSLHPGFVLQLNPRLLCPCILRQEARVESRVSGR